MKIKLGHSELWHILTTNRYAEKAHKAWSEFVLKSTSYLGFFFFFLVFSQVFSCHE